MKEVQVVAWCDGEHDQPVRAAVERREPLDGEPRVLDLCEPCDALFEKDLDTVRAWLLRGTVPPPPRRSHKSREKSTGPRAGIGGPKVPDMSGPEWRTCPEEGCVDGKSGVRYIGPTRTALGQHLRAKHDTKLGDYEWPLNL